MACFMSGLDRDMDQDDRGKAAGESGVTSCGPPGLLQPPCVMFLCIISRVQRVRTTATPHSCYITCVLLLEPQSALCPGSLYRPKSPGSTNYSSLTLAQPAHHWRVSCPCASLTRLSVPRTLPSWASTTSRDASLLLLLVGFHDNVRNHICL